MENVGSGSEEGLEQDGDVDPEDILLESDSGADEARFELICAELGNKNARKVLREIANGMNTSTSIAEKVGLTIQDVSIHLDRLVKVGMIKKSGKLSSFRGRRAETYRISRLAVLLIPAETANRQHLMELIKRKAATLVRKRLLAAIGMTGAISISFFLILLQSLAIHEVGEGRFGPTVSTDYSSALPIAFGAALLVTPLTFLLMKKIARHVK